MTEPLNTSTFCSDEHSEMLLNLYVDGELSSDEQAGLFGHLATCAVCRTQFNVLLAFRLALRQEAILVPLTADEAVFARIDHLRRTPRRAIDRVSERRFFGGRVHRNVPFRTAALAALVIVALGLALRFDPLPDSSTQSYHVTEAIMDDGALYVIGPGLTVEDKKLDR